MKKFIFLCGFLFLVVSAFGQDTSETKKTSGIKLGTFFQNDFYYSYDHYDYDYYTRYRSTEPGGYFYGAFEHAIEYTSGKIISIEPKLGLMLIHSQTGFFAGNDVKFFWINTGFFRFGASVYFGYRYINMERSETLSMENGMYQQIVIYQTHLQHIDTDLSLIPFQFNFPNSNFNLESHLGFGVSWRFEDPKGDMLNPAVEQQLKETSFHPYFPKLGIKVGYTF
ncbi:MAG: hypothetical protein R2764_15235 [Bacteroidales bacterium]